ncbi:type I-F CRISPR-associated protein Csy3 [Pontibacterium granulatum]|uniref:type I-F CRISPR-associated protein Csy3 n=1 Tax=Pontibacterium granulatum TaxID=2036029 RepID=UPI00249AFD35|nr:type I-F CRISPR-associated protein Csy3 [Pontibacterium granulatum]MDI3326791.1 type I-F CRISPR-associated protein Csy3 [Pontibacterium granulatum]
MDLCKHLSYTGSLRPGKAVFFYKTKYSDFEPLQVEVNKISGQKCSVTEGYTSNGAPKSLQPQDLAYSNPVVIESCYVPPTVSELFCRFSLRVLANSLQPSSCSDSEVFAQLSELAQRYKALGGYRYLAERYCKNLFMGNWLWRNQHARSLEIEVITSSNKQFKIINANRLDWCAGWSEEENGCLKQLAEEMGAALSDPSMYCFFDVTAKIQTEFCQEIIPSQLFTEKVHRGEPSRQYAKVECPDGKRAACFGASKVGAALQLIDDWWCEDGERRLRVHEYGADRKFVVAQRQPERGNDFYTLLRKAEQLSDELACLREGHLIPGDIHYLMSVLIKAGMFQRGGAA